MAQLKLPLEHITVRVDEYFIIYCLPCVISISPLVEQFGTSPSYQGAADPMIYSATQAGSGHTLATNLNNSNGLYPVIRADQPQAYAYMINSPRPEMYIVPTVAQQYMQQPFVSGPHNYTQQMYYPAQGPLAVNLNPQSMLYPQVIPQIAPIPVVAQSYTQAAFQQHQQFYQQNEYMQGNLQIIQQQQQFNQLPAQQSNPPPQQQLSLQQRHSTGSQLPNLHSLPRYPSSNSQQRSGLGPVLNPGTHQQHQREEIVEHKQT